MAANSSGLAPNDPLPHCKDHDAIHRLHLVWYGGVLALALPLNLVALGIFLGAYRLRTVVTVYMANLAACDLLFTLALPLRLQYYATHAWAMGDLLCQVAGSLFQINLYGSCLFLACINVDRFLALAYPLRARGLRRPQVAWRVCGGVWALIVLGSAPVALAHDTSQCQGPNGTLESRCFESFSQRAWREELLPLLALAEVLGFLLPLGAVVCCSVLTLSALLRRIRAGGGPALRRRKTVNLLVVSATIFVLCFAPYNVALAAYGLCKAGVVGSGPESRDRLRLALQLTVLLASANCCLDPLVYYFSTEGFRRTFRTGRAESWGMTLRSGGRGTGTGRGQGALVLAPEGRPHGRGEAGRRSGGGGRESVV
ncbi:lysophosphatidic acid receptor 5-like [Carcharodon carcharias]|uniref:lysophosphatidic acid receptor 5-like n=1 Tax=Carcharodon carcharias TaxID=13397 RepID=UPI001B7D977D|nr:lysophosphatidic acid receptor 5-like [Carcharodon carcharias]